MHGFAVGAHPIRTEPLRFDRRLPIQIGGGDSPTNDMNENDTTTWPLLFTYSGNIIGKGFIASVKFCGRLLAWLETEGVWMDGVNPGGLAVGGRTFEEANVELRDSLTKTLVGFADEAASFEAFKADVTRFYDENDAVTVAEWEAALAAVKSGSSSAPAGLQRKPANWKCFIEIELKRMEELTARDNAVSNPGVDTVLAKAA